MRIVFMGTPEFAVPSLSALYAAGYELVGVVAQPDRPVGRKRQLQMPPVKQRALELGLPVLQFEKLRRREGREALERLSPELMVTAAYGQILSQRILDIPALGTINVHASLLPAYRGPAPINWCLIEGETVTGVTTMMTGVGIDTGDILLQERLNIEPEEDAGQLTRRLAELGARLLLTTLTALQAGTLRPIPQDEARASYYPMLDKSVGQLDLAGSAQAAANRVRGVSPWPGAYLMLEGKPLKVWRAQAIPGQGPAGQVVASSPKEGLVVACGHGCLRLAEVQAPGGKRMDARDYLRGKPIAVGTRLGDSEGEA